MSKRRIQLRVRMNGLKRWAKLVNDQIKDEMKRPLPNALRLRALKARRLKLKDNLRRISKWPATPAE
ncbi:DUF465 domain-containing protein [Pseudohalocynthiibacter aestuariivivens]|uniref:DUF465 domain-containing protein n=2 Tax=Pseudohalocynthiibacter aestuariivivens TaxID=1591409 RepID=A0ABV5JAB5_9RHOB|nr:DUF465 domain-containing protein [Pseudohalocynthiibacter aestuariivivens]